MNRASVLAVWVVLVAAPGSGQQTPAPTPTLVAGSARDYIFCQSYPVMQATPTRDMDCCTIRREYRRMDGTVFVGDSSIALDCAKP